MTGLEKRRLGLQRPIVAGQMVQPAVELAGSPLLPCHFSNSDCTERAISTPRWRIILKNSGTRGKIRPSFDAPQEVPLGDRLRTNVFLRLTRRMKYPFTLSSPRSGRVEGFSVSQLSFSGSWRIHSPKYGQGLPGHFDPSGAGFYCADRLASRRSWILRLRRSKVGLRNMRSTSISACSQSATSSPGEKPRFSARK